MMINELPPEDGSYFPNEDNEPSEELLNKIWNFKVLELNYSNGSKESIGSWSWNGFDIMEEDAFDFDDDYDVIGKQYGLYLANQSASSTINGYETVQEAMLDAWYLYYNVLAYTRSEV